MMKRTFTAGALAAVLVAPAFAQAPASKTDTPNGSMGTTGQTSFVQKESADDWRGTKLIGASVYGPDNASIGEISDVLIAGDGKVKAVVVGVGGFLGVGEKDVALPFYSLDIRRKPDSSSIDKIRVSYSKDQLKNAPAFAFNDMPMSQTTGSSVTDKLKSMSPADTSSKQ
ncbi:MAG TPA: PRC-barrel domain-containing protein [Pseudolabrys sp.]|jgi:hypothetical protein